MLKGDVTYTKRKRQRTERKWSTSLTTARQDYLVYTIYNTAAYEHSFILRRRQPLNALCRAMHVEHFCMPSAIRGAHRKGKNKRIDRFETECTRTESETESRKFSQSTACFCLSCHAVRIFFILYLLHSTSDPWS